MCKGASGEICISALFDLCVGVTDSLGVIAFKKKKKTFFFTVQVEQLNNVCLCVGLWLLVWAGRLPLP